MAATKKGLLADITLDTKPMPVDDTDEASEEELSAAESVLDAIEAKDAPALASAMRALWLAVEG